MRVSRSIRNGSSTMRNVLVLAGLVSFIIIAVVVYTHGAVSPLESVRHSSEALNVQIPMSHEALVYASTNGVGDGLKSVVNEIIKLKPQFPDRVFTAMKDFVASLGGPPVEMADPSKFAPLQSVKPVPPMDAKDRFAFDPLSFPPSKRNLYVATLSSLVYDNVSPGGPPPDAGFSARLDLLRRLQPKLKYIPNHDRVAVIVEPRCTVHLERAVRLHLAMLGPYHWNLHVWHSHANEDCLRQQLAGHEYKRSVASIANFDVMFYNNLLRSREFWDAIDGPPETRVLIFQQDSMFCRSGIEEFTPYEYVGAPWPIGWKELAPGELGGNGGLSIRGKDAMIDSVTNVQLDDVYPYRKRYGLDRRGNFDGFAVVEDLFFSHAIVMRGRKMAPRSVARLFSSEVEDVPESMGVHKFLARSAESCAHQMAKHFNVPQRFVNELVASSLHGDLDNFAAQHGAPRDGV